MYPCSDWGNNGLLIDPPHGDVQTIAADADGALVLAGRMGADFDLHSTVMRLRSDGSRDPAFATNGIRTDALSTAAADWWESISVRPGGGWYVSGSAVKAGESIRHVTSVALGPDGTSDNAMCALDERPSDLTKVLSAREVDNHVMLVLTRNVSDRDTAVERRDSACAIDDAYATAGRFSLPGGMLSATVLPDGGVIMATGAVWRLDSTGAPAPGFEPDGVVTLPPTASEPWIRTVSRAAVAVAADGAILVALTTTETVILGEGQDRRYALVVHRLDGRGVLDTSFGVNGTARVEPYMITTSVAPLADGGMVLAGWVPAPSSGIAGVPTVVWLDSAGNVQATDDAPGYLGRFFAVTSLSDGRIVAAGDDFERSRVLAVCFDR
jgi:hypothetical protein